MNTTVPEQSVLDCLAANYGIHGKLTRLPGENLNFLVEGPLGDRQVVKIVDDHMPPAVVAMESAAMKHAVMGGFQPQLPEFMENIYGNIETGIHIHLKEYHRLIVKKFVNGTELSSLSDISTELLFDLGRTLATFNRVMENFDHPAAHRNHRWNLAEAGQHQDKVGLIGDPAKRELLRWAFGVWAGAREGLAGLPWQFIHGDAHDENVLVEGAKVAGLIDFGDCCHNPAVCDLAICLTYLMMHGDDPLVPVALIASGYQTVRPLSESERALLYPLICGRLAVSICIANQRKTIDPGNPNWFGGEGAAWRLLQFLNLSGFSGFLSKVMN